MRKMDINDRDTVMKLDSIFMPYATKRREAIVERNGRFVHYTSADNAIKIIQSKEFWMRNARCMNDYLEVSHGYEFLVKFFKDANHKELFCETLEPCGNEIARNALSLFDKWWNRIEFNTFISTISEHDPSENIHGRLSMWRAYGRLSAKAAIVLNVPFEPYNATKGLNLLFSPVAYFSYQDAEKELVEVISNIKNNIDFLVSLGSDVITNNIFAMLVMAAVSFKHEGFKEEREWRVIYLPDLYPSKLILRSIETINGVPQNVYKIPLEDNPTENVTGISIPQLVERVIIGPSEYSLPLYEVFKVALEEAGLENSASRVIISDIPLRT
jgi:hypothetical protein